MLQDFKGLDELLQQCGGHCQLHLQCVWGDVNQTGKLKREESLEKHININDENS